MLVLQQLFNLSDDDVEFQVNDRRTFEKFVGLGVMNDEMLHNGYLPMSHYIFAVCSGKFK